MLVAFSSALFGIFSPGYAHDGVTSYTLPRTEVVDYHASQNDVDYRLYVQTPRPGTPKPKNGFPILFLLDADYAFPVASAVVDHFVDRDNLDPMIIVGIAYPKARNDMRVYRMERTRDYTPFFVPDGGYGSEFQKQSGGGPAFLNVIKKEFTPLVAERFGGNPNDLGINGHSYGGLFASWVLKTQPQSFQHYIITSPSLWYKERSLLTNGAFQKSGDVQVFMGVDSYDNPPKDSNLMVSDVMNFAQELKKHDPHIRLSTQLFFGEFHNSVFPASFTRGILTTYGE